MAESRNIPQITWALVKFTVYSFIKPSWALGAVDCAATVDNTTHPSAQAGRQPESNNAAELLLQNLTCNVV